MRVKVYDIETDEAAAMLGVTPETLRRWARAGWVPAKRTLRRRWVFAADDLRYLPVRKVTEL